jgi:CobQ-like glutamine amidotransferase family enzyme
MIAFQHLRGALLGVALMSPAMPLHADDGDADAQFGNQGRAIHSWPSSTIQSETTAVATGNDGSVEGAVQGRILCTYLHGPVLPRNPQLADLLLSRVVGDMRPLDLDEVALLRRERLRA